MASAIGVRVGSLTGSAMPRTRSTDAFTRLEAGTLSSSGTLTRDSVGASAAARATSANEVEDIVVVVR